MEADTPKKLQGLVRGMSSDDYHGHKGTWSSSQLKKMHEDPELFHRLYIAKTEEKETMGAFDVGNYFHTAILEPEKLETETAVYDGVRRGKEWEKFQADNKGRYIITKNEHVQAATLISAVKNSPIAMNRIARSESEVSAFIDVIVSCGEVFTMDKKYYLSKHGWNSSKGIPFSAKDAITLTLKVRADKLADDFILDLKSTTGNAKNKFQIMNTISKYCYDLSAALYLDVFTLATEKVRDEFVWTFASKDIGNCKNYIADQDNILIGRAKWRKSVINLAHNIAEGWAFEESIDYIGPNYWEREILQQKGSDLL